MSVEVASSKTSISLYLEGFSEPLHVQVPVSISREEFQSFMNEIIANYICRLQKQNKLGNDSDKILIIDSVNEYKVGRLSADSQKRYPAFGKVPKTNHGILRTRVSERNLFEVKNHGKPEQVLWRL